MDVRRIPVCHGRSVPPAIHGLCRLPSARFLLRGLFVGLAAVAICLAGPGPARAELAVARAVFATGVVAREPVGEADRFSSDVERVYFFTQILGADGPTDILHVWMHEGVEKAIVPLAVGAGSWRTWSSKKILPTWVGRWTVEVRDLDGRVLASGSFRIE